MFNLIVLAAAEQDLKSLDKPVTKRISKRIKWLAENLEHFKPEPLTGEWARFFKLRVGDYRVIYKIIHDERLIVIHRIRHRREVYKEK